MLTQKQRFRAALRTPEQVERLAQALNMRLPCMVAVGPLERPKGLSQLRLLFALLTEWGDHAGYSKSEAKELFKKHYGPEVEVRGEMVLKSLSEYTREEISALIEHVYRDAAENGWILESYEAP